MTIIDRIASKKEKIAKLNALIEKKRESIAKKTENLAKLTGWDREDAEYRIECLEGEIFDRQKDIQHLEKEIRELQPLLDKFNERQQTIDNLRNVLGVFMDDLEKSWNEYDEKMLDEVTPRHRIISAEENAEFQKYFDELSGMSREDASAAYKPYFGWFETYNWKGIIPEAVWSNQWRKEDICRNYAHNKVSDAIKNRMTKAFGVGYDKYLIGYHTTKEEMLAKFQKENHQAVESLVLDLQNRIAYKVGEITDYSHLTVGMKALNGSVTGKLGTCRVESILAGGYNIQRLHVRVLVK